jgi:flavin-dependent dehydrogenase
MTAVLVAGGGVAGAAAACLLARAGHPVRLFERQAAPADKICGEFLSQEALFYLARLGVDPAALGAQPITHLRLVRDSRAVTSALPFRGMALTRRALDEALLARAAAAGVEVTRGQAVKVQRDGADWWLEAGAPVRGRALLLATGKQDLRGAPRRVGRAPEDLVGLKDFFHLQPEQQRALAGHVEIILFPGGYGGLQMVEGGRANFCLLIERARLREAGGTWRDLLGVLMAQSAHLRARLSGATALLAQPLAIYRVPYGFVHEPASDDPPAVFRVGDQFGVIPSFAGDGIAMALHGAAMAAACLAEGGSATAFHRRLRRDLAAPIARAGRLYRFGRQPAGQALLLPIAARLPAALRLAARLTRVPDAALLGA